MKAALEQLVREALSRLGEDVLSTGQVPARVAIERARDSRHGDFATNVAMTLARAARRNPRELAGLIVEAVPASPEVDRVEIAGPGFINFFLTPAAYHAELRRVFKQGDRYGRQDLGGGRRVQVEFVSANPTGPLHVGHGRGAAYGASVASLLAAVGYDVHREYYVNDAGRQMDILALSVWLRYLERCGVRVDFPEGAYQGHYVRDIAEELYRGHGETLRRAGTDLYRGLPENSDADTRIDALIRRAGELLGDEAYAVVHNAGIDAILADIREDLEEFGVVYDEWFSERSLVDSGAVDDALTRLEEAGYLYRWNGATWFRSTDFGDEKDRVVVRENGVATYFASDLAYHLDKRRRGFAHIIDIWGADHHGYVPRVRAGFQALGGDPDMLDVLLVQFAVLYRGGRKVSMSTRSGEFETLRDLRREVGNDAARFFYIMRSNEQHLDFDMDLARSQTSDNPVYYVQYAHARICSVMRQLREKRLGFDQARGLGRLELLRENHEQALMTAVSRYPEVVESAASGHAPHQLAHYLRELANALHTYYNAHTFLVDDDELRDARLCLILATRQVLRNGCGLLGIGTPETM
ncbi:MAG TPA: arginine--tRNA ligase [Gammaproteobacteria bacterium]|nr:arginine--tRNA ligase [Gammaproteobacteria bacterium]